jgi:hypothetical protein
MIDDNIETKIRTSLSSGQKVAIDLPRLHIPGALVAPSPLAGIVEKLRREC